MPKRHEIGKDYTCMRCGWLVTPPIPHECDPSICDKCNGAGKIFKGRQPSTGRWIGWDQCVKCEGTGKIVFGGQT